MKYVINKAIYWWFIVTSLVFGQSNELREAWIPHEISLNRNSWLTKQIFGYDKFSKKIKQNLLLSLYLLKSQS